MRMLVGDVIEKLQSLDSREVSCIVTSPPYYLQRKYGNNPLEWGSEKNFVLYLEKMQTLMKELYRVLEPRGTCFINIGDKYAKRTERIESFPDHAIHVEKGSLFGIPGRFQANCIDAGWLCENAIVWKKNNAMPLSVTQRLTNKYEPVYFLAKQKNHHFNLNAIKVLAKTQKPPKFNLRVREAKKHRLEKKYGDEWKASTKELAEHDDKGVRKQDTTLDSSGKVLGHYRGFNKRWKESFDKHKGPYMKNPGDVIDIPVARNPFFHYAAYPEKLVEVFLKSGCRKGGVVLDPFMGSGTTAVVAERLGLKWIGIELYKDYAEKAKKRIIEARER